MHQRRVMRNAITGPMNTAPRMKYVIWLIDRCSRIAMMSLPPAAQKRPYIVISATIVAVRVGASRGRWSRWWSRLSPVIQASMNGSSSRIVNITIGSTMIGSSTFQEIVWPQMWVSQLGMIRSAPSGQPMYQSGWEPAVTLDGS